MREPADNPFSSPAITDHHWKDTMPEYNWMKPLPDPSSASADVRFWIETLALWLGTDGAAEQMDEIHAVASEAVWYEGGPSNLAGLVCGWLSSAESFGTLAHLHGFTLALSVISQDAAEHLTADDSVTRALLPWIAAPDALEVLGEASALCVKLATLAGASDQEITEWVTSWQTSDAARTLLGRIAAPASVLAGLAEEIITDTGAEI